MTGKRAATPKAKGTPKSRQGTLPPQAGDDAEAPPPMPPSLGPWGTEWVADMKSSDPVFADGQKLDRLERLIAPLTLQPFAHSNDHLFPNYAIRLGFERFLPGKSTSMGKRGPLCYLADGETARCHYPCFPAFMYT